MVFSDFFWDDQRIPALSTPTADSTAFKCLINSVLSTPFEKNMTADIRNFYCNTPMEGFKYMKLPFDIIHEEIINQYNLRLLEHDNGYVKIEIRKGMYSVPRAGCIVNNQL